MVFKKKQSAVDEQIAEIDKLNAVINAAERDMLKLRKVWVVFIWGFRGVVGHQASAALKMHTVAFPAQNSDITHTNLLRLAIPFCSNNKIER